MNSYSNYGSKSGLFLPLVEDIRKEYPNNVYLKAQWFGYGVYSKGYIDIMPSSEAKEYLEALASDAKWSSLKEKYTEEQIEEFRLSVYRPDPTWFSWVDLKRLLQDDTITDPIAECERVIERYKQEWAESNPVK